MCCCALNQVLQYVLQCVKVLQYVLQCDIKCCSMCCSALHHWDARVWERVVAECGCGELRGRCQCAAICVAMCYRVLQHVLQRVIECCSMCCSTKNAGAVDCAGDVTETSRVASVL